MKKALIILVVLTQIIFLASLCFAQEFDIGGVEMSSGSGMELHGYYEFEYWSKENATDTFDAHKITIWMGATIVPKKVFVSGEFEYEHFPVTEDGEGQGAIKVDSAQISIIPIEDTRIGVGAFYVPFGIEYESYPGHKNKLITRPKAMKSGHIINGTWSDVGIAIEQKIPKVGQLDVYTVNGNAKNSRMSRDSDEGGNDNKSVGVRASVTALDGLNVGASYVTGKYGAGGTDADGNTTKADNDKSTRTGVHLKVDGAEVYGCPLGSMIIAEYVTGTDEMDSDVTDDDGNALDRDMSGYYVQLSLKPLKMAGNEDLEFAVRYGAYDADEEVENNGKTELSFGLDYKLYEHTIVKAEYQINEDEADDGSDSGVDDNIAVVGVVVDW